MNRLSSKSNTSNRNISSPSIQTPNYNYNNYNRDNYNRDNTVFEDNYIGLDGRTNSINNLVPDISRINNIGPSNNDYGNGTFDFTSNINRPSIDRPSIDRPDITRPDISRPDISRPDISRPSIDKPSIDRPSIDRPSIDRPKISRPNISRPKIQIPKINKPSITKPVIDISSNNNYITFYDNIDICKGKPVVFRLNNKGYDVSNIFGKTYKPTMLKIQPYTIVSLFDKNNNTNKEDKEYVNSYGDREVLVKLPTNMNINKLYVKSYTFMENFEATEKGINFTYTEILLILVIIGIIYYCLSNK
jgi:hypothetical protein